MGFADFWKSLDAVAQKTVAEKLKPFGWTLDPASGGSNWRATREEPGVGSTRTELSAATVDALVAELNGWRVDCWRGGPSAYRKLYGAAEEKAAAAMAFEEEDDFGLDEGDTDVA